jgi:hypothetical protein
MRNDILATITIFSFLSITAVGATQLTDLGLNEKVAVDNSVDEELTDNVDQGYNIKVFKNGELLTTTHNALMEGEEAIQHAIGEGYNTNSYTYDTITVGNGTAPGDASTSLDSEWDSCGLTPTSATYDDIGDGQWNYSATFNVGCDDIIINTTAIKSPSAPTDIDYFAGADLNRDINAYSGDTLTIEWSHTADGT